MVQYKLRPQRHHSEILDSTRSTTIVTVKGQEKDYYAGEMQIQWPPTLVWLFNVYLLQELAAAR